MFNKYLRFSFLLFFIFSGTYQTAAQTSVVTEEKTLDDKGSAASDKETAAESPGSPSPDDKINLIPIPVNLEKLEGTFTLTAETRILIDPNNQKLRELAAFFAEMLAAPTGFTLDVAGRAKATGIEEQETVNKEEQDSRRTETGKTISLILNKVGDQLIRTEGYRMEVSPQQVSISANEPAGLFYGMQTLMQLLPAQIESEKAVKGLKWEIPCVRITDFPRFGWRGLMLDVSRHFFPVPFIKKYIDQLVKYKMNVFHWHLTDDQGWRIEIKSLPKLTSIGAWRVPRTGLWWEREKPKPGELPSYGGYYTQEEIREIISYAEKRFVTVLPEIDVPGHSLAAIAAYPEYACVTDNYHVNPGSRFYTEVDNSLCAGNEKTYQFLDKVFTELAQLFPGEYIHMGGDEAYKGFWRKCPKCQRKMREEGLKNVNELQSYFVKRVEKILNSKGKKLIGWDEILQGGLAPEATVMSWRGMSGGIRAAEMGHHVIMTPSDHCYLDLYQGDPEVEPPTYSMLRLTDSYNWNPLPPDIDEKWVLGGQGNLWTESVPNPRHAEYMTWPRGLALAEVFWSPEERKNWNDFIRRMEVHFKRFDITEVNYSQSVYDPIVTPKWGPGKKDMLITLSTEVPGTAIFYTFDGTYPDKFLNQYLGEPLSVPKDADTFRVITYKNGKPAGKMITYKIPNLYGKLPAPM